jgi:KUP system potassium uptake protein
VQLGFSPRVTVVHTSEGQCGQIYVPEVNRALMVACVALVAGFRSSDKLAAAYGLAVTGTMTVTTIAYFVVLRATWKWSPRVAVPLCGFFLAIDLAFLVANLRKFSEGGWVPFSIGVGVFVLFTTWMSGRKRLGAYLASVMLPLDAFLSDVAIRQPMRTPGFAVFLTANTGGVPTLLLHYFKHTQVLHEKVLLLTITSAQVPFMKPSERLEVEELGEGFYRMIGRFGYMETPAVPALLESAAAQGLAIDLARTTYFLGRETLIASNDPGMARWRKILFAFTARNARSATAYFGIPPNRVMELGMQIEL